MSAPACAFPWSSPRRFTDGSYPTTYVGTEYSHPIKSDVADVVVATNMLEHVGGHGFWIRELARICKPGGYVITINPPPSHSRLIIEKYGNIYDHSGWRMRTLTKTLETLRLPVENHHDTVTIGQK